MGKYMTENSVLCPFYRAEESHCIHCEGLEDNSSIRLTYAHMGKKKAYRDRFCKDEYKKCRIAGMLFEKWEEEDG